MTEEKERDGKKLDRHTSGCTHTDADIHFHIATGEISGKGESCFTRIHSSHILLSS